MACAGPETQRIVHGDVDAELFWWCDPLGDGSTGHVMTSMGNMAGYSIVSFAPNQALTNVRRVCWNVNLTAFDRQWFEVLVIPEATFQANGRRLDYVSPPIEEVDETAGRMSAGMVLWQQELQGAPTLYVGRNLVYQDSYGFRVTDRAYRYRHCFFDNGNGTITLEQEQANGFVRRAVTNGSFPTGSVRVVFKSHSYDPGKGGGADHGTWHWDNIEIGGSP